MISNHSRSAELTNETSTPPCRSPRSRRSRRAEHDDLLYPALLDEHPLRRQSTWWDRLRWTVARHIDEKTHRRETRRIRTDGIRRYQRELSWRASAALIRRVRDGWWLGPPPYGYRVTAHQVDDGTGRQAQRQRLTIDEQRAHIVSMIFTWFVHDGLGPTAIATRLAGDPVRFPPPLDHGTDQPRRWTPGVARGILNNPAYLGYVIRYRIRNGRAQVDDRWVCSIQPSHPALVDKNLWWAARDKLHPELRPTNTVTDGSPGVR